MSIFHKNKSPRLIGFSGTFASGKDTASDYLVETKNFMHLSCGDVLRMEATKQNKDHERITLIEIAVELRKEYGSLGALVLKGIDLWSDQEAKYKGGLVISGLRIIAESEEIKSQNGLLIFIDAPVELRYERIVERAKTDKRFLNFNEIRNIEAFKESERSELLGLGGPERPNLRGIEQISDVVIQNTGTLNDYIAKINDKIF